VVGSSLAASVAIHLGLLALIAAVWAPPVRETLGELIPVRILPMAGDGRGDQTAPREPPPPADAPKTLPSAGVRSPAEARPRRETAAAPDVAGRLAELEAGAPVPLVALGPTEVGGPKMVVPVPGGSSAGAESGSARAGDVTGVASALAALGASDALGGAGASTGAGAPGYRANPKPEYPPQARDQGLQGLVLLRVRVLPDGKAGEVLVERSSGHAILDQAALRAVKAWLFVPATRNGIAVASWASVPVRFSLGS
jgi:protein TonB